MKLLAFELSTEACSVALWVDGEVHARHDIAPRRHAELALPWADALLADAGVTKSQLDAIAVGRGPGAFTGVRLGISIAQGIALALDLPVVPVSTLAALASRAAQAGAGEGAHVLAAIDARMREVYAARFRLSASASGLWPEALDVERVQPPADVVLPDIAADTVWYGVGTGFSAEQDALQARCAGRLAACDPLALPHASDVARLAAIALARGDAIASGPVEPAYLRDNVALTIAEQQALRASRG